MAVLSSPRVDYSGASGAPVSASVIVASANIMKAGPPAILTRPALATPSVDQLLNTSGGYAV